MLISGRSNSSIALDEMVIFLLFFMRERRLPWSAIICMIFVNDSLSLAIPRIFAISSAGILLMSAMFLSVASLWAYSSETPSSINRFFVALFTTIQHTPAQPSTLYCGTVGGPDGVRTRDHRVKSPTLYLTELQAQRCILGFQSELPSLLILYR